VDLDVPDLLEGLAADPGTRAVALLIEHVRRGPRFLEAVARLHASRTALIVMRIGRTAGGQRAATSHTGGIASDSRIFQAICRDVGVPVAHELDELIELAAAHAVGPRPGGPGVGIVTSSGGAAVLSADAVEDAGLTLPAPSGATLARLTALIPQAATVGNPLDLSAAQGPALFEAALRTAVEEPAYDALLVPLTMLAGTQAEAVAQVVGRVSREASKPVWVVWSAGRLADPGRRRLARLGCPVFATPTRAAQALRALLTPARQDGFTPALPVRRIPDRAVAFLSGPPGARSEWRTRALLALYGLPSPPEQLVETRDAAVAAAVTLGFPVALKVQATALPHKRAAGVMRLGLADAAAVAQAWDEVLAMARAANSTAELEGVLVQTMVSPESELLLGLYRDAAFGPILACGPGGSGVEAAADEVEFVRPLENRAAFLEWLTATRLARRLLGSDALDTVAGALTIVAEVVRDLGDRLREFDLNPLALVDGGRRALVLDALAVVASESSPNASE
jgi:acyl-CoA synthetase (NDP forming)